MVYALCMETMSSVAFPRGRVMLQRLRLVSHHLCPYVQRGVILLSEKDVAHERVYIDLSNKPDWFLSLSPLGKVPVLIVDETPIFESAVICEYLDETIEPRMHPTDPLERARHRSWIEFASAILSGIAGLYNATDEPTFEQRSVELHQRFAWLEQTLHPSGPYFAGQRFHIVDAVFGPVFRYFDTFDRLGDFGILTDHTRVAAWRSQLSDHPSVKSGVIDDYDGRLFAFLAAKQSVLGKLANRSQNPAVEAIVAADRTRSGRESR